MAQSSLTSKRVEVPEDMEAISDFYYQKGWTDGLPIICPTEERVLRMLRCTDRRPADVVAQLAPVYADATVEKIAVNAVMAGCLPEHLPVLVAAVEALGDKVFNLYGVQTTTNPVAPLLIVNGPIARELDINSGASCMGPSKRANAAIGRAVRFLLINVGGGQPGAVDKATFGQPAKFTFCIAEAEEASPWAPLHVERGYGREDSTVTTCGVASMVNVITMPEMLTSPSQGEQILTVLADNMSGLGSNNFRSGIGEPLVAFSPETTATLSKDGFSKLDAKKFLFEASKRTTADLPSYVATRMRYQRRHADTDVFYITERPEDIMLVVCGGLLAAHTVFMPTFATSQSVTRPIARKDGTPVRSVRELVQG